MERKREREKRERERERSFLHFGEGRSERDHNYTAAREGGRELFTTH